MRIRGYRKGDVEAMFLLDVACFTPPFQFDRAMMQEVAETSSAIVVILEEDVVEENILEENVLEENHAMLGFVIAHVQGNRRHRHAYIVTIDVAPSSRNRGMGAALLQHVEARASAAGLKSVGLHVAVDNVSAIAFYQRQGYEQIGREKNFYREAGTDALVYAKAL